MRIILFLLLALISFVLLSCEQGPVKPKVKKSLFQKQLVQKRIANTNFYISLPANYIVKGSQGVDFDVYYFYPSDSTDKAHFSGGMYFGNSPHFFDPQNSKCHVWKVKSNILKSNAQWVIYNCAGEYTVRTTVESGSKQGWNSLVHAFGKGPSKLERDKLFEVYETLKLKQE
jgi:hypothetical protein